MREFLSTVTSRGRVTIPAEIRRRLGLRTGDKVGFVLTDGGRSSFMRPLVRRLPPWWAPPVHWPNR